jgi:hypothetical protein
MLVDKKNGPTVADIKNCTQNGEYLFTGQNEWTESP